MSNTTLYDAATELLTVCADALSPNVPARAFVSPGLPALDCDTLAVHCASILKETTAPQGISTQGSHKLTQPSLNYAVFNVTIARCVPVASQGVAPPAPAQYTAAAASTMSDGWTLWNAIGTAKRNGTLYAPKDREVRLDPAVPIIGGGLAGWMLQVVVQIDGYVVT